MKNQYILKSAILIISCVFFNSCTVEKRLYNSGFNIQWKKGKNTAETIKSNEEVKADNEEEIPFTKTISSEDALKSDMILTDNLPSVEISQSDEKSEIEESFDDPNCDVMTLKSGEEISVKVLEIGTQEIKYKNCDNLDGPIISIKKQEVFMIKYPSGKKDIIKSEENLPQQSDIEKESNGLAITSMILGILGIIPVLAIIFGAIAKNQIAKQPNKYRSNSEKFANAGMILGFVWFFLLLFLLVAFL